MSELHPKLRLFASWCGRAVPCDIQAVPDSGTPGNPPLYAVVCVVGEVSKEVPLTIGYHAGEKSRRWDLDADALATRLAANGYTKVEVVAGFEKGEKRACER